MDISTYNFNIFQEQYFIDERIVIKELSNEYNRDQFRITITIDKDEKEKFNLYLKNCLISILENIYANNKKIEIRLRGDSYESVFIDIIELIILNKSEFDCETSKLHYYVNDKIKFLTLITLQHKENENFEYNFIVTLELTLYYLSNKIECGVKNIDIQYKITENNFMKLNNEKNLNMLLINKKGLGIYFKELNARNYLNYNKKLNYVSLIKNETLNVFHNIIREILISKGIETNENKLYSLGLFRTVRSNLPSNRIMKCKICLNEHTEAIKIFFNEAYHKCKYYMCMNCFSTRRNLRIINDNCLNCENYLINFFMMKKI